jgi:hypothetical protein
MSTRILLAIALLLWSVAPADAALVQWHFEGPADGFWPPVAAGSPVLLDWAFDTTAPNLQEVRGIPDSSFYYVNNVALTFGGWRYPSYATLESAFDLRDGDSSGQSLVALRLFWLRQAVQIDPSAPGLPYGVAPFCDWPNCDSYLLLPARVGPRRHAARRRIVGVRRAVPGDVVSRKLRRLHAYRRRGCGDS